MGTGTEQSGTTSEAPPCHRAVALCGGGREAKITLGGQTDRLTICRAGKLILTKQPGNTA